MPHLDPVSLASLIGAAALALSRLLVTAKPLWDHLPPWLQGLVPALVLVLPQIATAALGVHTSLDLANLLVLSAALILPGAHSHTVGPKDPPADSPPVARIERISFEKPTIPDGEPPAAAMRWVPGLACLLLLGCSNFHANWPALGACLDPLRPGLVPIVADVLAGNGDAEADLATLGTTEGLSAVECAVQQLLSDIGSKPTMARASRISERGRAFLAKVQR